MTDENHQKEREARIKKLGIEGYKHEMKQKFYWTDTYLIMAE